MAPRLLVIYGTTEGQTAKIAVAIADALRGEGAYVDVFEAGRGADDIRPERYDATVVAASVHAAGYQRGVRKWVGLQARGLNERPSAFVSVCLGVLEHNPKTDAHLNQIIDRFLDAARWKPAVRKIVAGALPYSKYGWLKRRMMRRIVAKAGGDTDTSRDYEYTDWKDVRAFAVDFYRSSVPAAAPARREMLVSS